MKAYILETGDHVDNKEQAIGCADFIIKSHNNPFKYLTVCRLDGTVWFHVGKKNLLGFDKFVKI